MITLHSQPQCRVLTEHINQIYSDASFNSWMQLSMTCTELQQCCTPEITNRPIEAFEIYISTRTKFSKYLKKNWTSEVWTWGIRATSLALTIGKWKQSRRLYNEIPVDCPKIIKQCINVETGKPYTITVPDHPNYGDSGDALAISFLSGVTFLFSEMVFSFVRFEVPPLSPLSFSKKFEMSESMRQLLPYFCIWKEEKMNKKRPFPVLDDHGHLFDFHVIRRHILVSEAKNPNQPVRCPRGGHDINLGSLILDKDSFDATRMHKRTVKERKKCQEIQRVIKNPITFKDYAQCTAYKVQTLFQTIPQMGTWLLQASSRALHMLSFTRK